MKKCNLILGLVGSLFLVSCGSSSGSSSHSELVYKVTGNYIRTVLGTSDLSDIEITQNNLNHKILVVDGEKIDVNLPKGEHSDSVYALIDSQDFLSSNTKYENSTFGLITNSVKTKTYIFSQGNKTKEMPATGTASYHGDAVIVLVDNEGTLNCGSGYSQFEVDFENKKLSGVIPISHATKIELAAKIKGNKFVGQSEEYITSDGKKKFKTQTEGGFYGPNAEEMSGVFKEINKNEFSGSFGAIKQEE